jgi:hypothetical protein
MSEWATAETFSAGVVIANGQTTRQRCDQWCWAACIETVFSSHGYKVNQEEVVKKVFDSEVCSPASAAQVIAAVGGVWSNKAGSSFRAVAHALPDVYLANRFPTPPVAREGVIAPPRCHDATTGMEARAEFDWNLAKLGVTRTRNLMDAQSVHIF